MKTVVYLLSACCLAILLSACGDHAGDPAHALKSGDICSVDSGSSYAPLTTSEGTYTQWTEAERANNKVVKVRMAYNKEAFMLQPGTKVAVKGFGSANGMTLYKVEVQDGMYAGITGWMAEAHLHKT